MATKPPDPNPAIALAGWSLHRRFRRQDRPLTLLEFPEVACGEFGIRHIELNSPFFEYADPGIEDGSWPGPIAEGYLDRLLSASQAAGVEIVGIAVDHHGDLSTPKEEERSRAVRRHARWIEACKNLGCQWFRTNSGATDVGPVTEAHEQACIRSFAELAEQAGRCGVSVLMENHWGLSEDPERMARVLAAVDHEYCGALADFRNWPAHVNPYDALAAIAPHARSVHAKFLAFDAQGHDPGFDTPRALDILRRTGFAGRFAIEFEGELDDHDGVLKSKALLERLL